MASKSLWGCSRQVCLASSYSLYSLNVSPHRWLWLVRQTMADGVENFSRSLEILISGMLTPLYLTIKRLKQMAWMKGSLYLHLFDSNRLFFLDLTNACLLDRQNTISATKNLELILSGLREPINRSATQISELHDSFKREYENHLFCQILWDVWYRRNNQHSR